LGDELSQHCVRRNNFGYDAQDRDHEGHGGEVLQAVLQHGQGLVQLLSLRPQPEGVHALQTQAGRVSTQSKTDRST